MAVDQALEELMSTLGKKIFSKIVSPKVAVHLALQYFLVSASFLL